MLALTQLEWLSARARIQPFSALRSGRLFPARPFDSLSLAPPAFATTIYHTYTMPTPATFKPTLILHGGAGNYERATLPPELYAAYHASLQSYLRSAHDLLKNGTTALDAAVHAVSLMEDDPLFNCGRGSVFTTAGTIEMEASVMVTTVRDTEDSTPLDGAIKRGAGVMGLKNVRHPIRLARESLLHSGCTVDGTPTNDGGSLHSQLHGSHVEALARGWGLEFKPDEWFWTRRRWDEHRRGLKGEKEPVFLSQGTVGCVCLDQWGDLAVATSTGGITNKLPGRIGDTPTLGAGFWAESWDELLPHNPSAGFSSSVSSLGEFVQEARLWLADCLPPLFREPRGPSYTTLSTSPRIHQPGIYSEKPCQSYQAPPANRQTKKRAIAVSGTGNGDSFLRVAAARTVAAMLRFSAKDSLLTLADAVTAVAGPGGELQLSAGPRWNVTGEGAGGVIGIEAESSPIAALGGNLRRGKVVFDFNCGGMLRAWIDEDSDGRDIEKVMVFREEYR
ncbi:uncharacterized protein N7459_001327 [Penicillium hispanicum]|uniref:uncharacterized protein n=1 Tax=Penicillium hispanicum TaxID=1080232 RepID=UPI00253F6E56|nr:uncharacterized protein N7459_001327 [Penicillium hispanicum]KAJ5595119.1 hypothetical protein N7459_001327 [Penicillium hispanicum]